MNKILVVDDDKDIAKLISIYLTNINFDVVVCHDGLEALELIDDSFNFIILDVMMPNLDGIETCKRIRNQYDTPILFLTAKHSEVDIVEGFLVGADDYLAKPFNVSELVSRINAILKRVAPKQSDKVFACGLEIDRNKYQVIYDDTNIELTKKEFLIIELLSRHKSKVFSVENIYEAVWEDDPILDYANTVMVHIRSIRKKLANHGCEDCIQTVWGVGYKIEK